ncbi:OLC1v1030482C1 [Oldenlandia corymbosa var. corymbosa]|nr:OLC1v1030482C1 [Oldenlandia corymbosa var. corymbosa]
MEWRKRPSEPHVKGNFAEGATATHATGCSRGFQNPQLIEIIEEGTESEVALKDINVRSMPEPPKAGSEKKVNLLSRLKAIHVSRKWKRLPNNSSSTDPSKYCHLSLASNRSAENDHEIQSLWRRSKSLEEVQADINVARGTQTYKKRKLVAQNGQVTFFDSNFNVPIISSAIKSLKGFAVVVPNQPPSLI